jgi:hypothetical protein
MTNLWINDLRVAASFVRSIHTDDHELNFELQILADRIDVLIADVGPPGLTPIASKGSLGEAEKS